MVFRRAKNGKMDFGGKNTLLPSLGLTQDFLYPSQKKKQQHFLCRKNICLAKKKLLFTMGVFCSKSSVSCCQKLPDRLTALALFDLDWLRPPAAGREGKRNSDETSILLLSIPEKMTRKRKDFSFFHFSAKAR